MAALGPSWPGDAISEAARLLRAGNGKFPAGARALPPDLVDAVQRERILAAMLRACRELGYSGLTVQDVLVRGGVSRPTFYEQFCNKEDCFLAAFDSAAARLRKHLQATTREVAGRWQDRLRMGLGELLRFVGAEPDAAWTLVVEARAAGPTVLRRRDELLDSFAACIDSEVRADTPSSMASAVAAAGVVGGVETLLYNRLTRGETHDLQPLLPSMMFFAVLSYEGHGAAVAELADAPYPTGVNDVPGPMLVECQPSASDFITK